MFGLLTDSIFKEHLSGEGHPERPERLDAVGAALERIGAIKDSIRIPARAATDEELARCHTPGYIELVKRELSGKAGTLSTGDATYSARSLEVARKAAGGVLNAVDAVLEGKVHTAFCAVRPPGHHATPDRGMGFCLFNNIAIAARHAQKKHGVGKVLIVDWDVHHGNGTQDIFYRDGSVFYFSTHQSPWYPGTGAVEETGAGPGKGTTLNAPCAAGAGRKEIFQAFEGQLLPAMAKFKPDFVMISAGFDSRVGDPLGQLKLTDHDFADLTHLMLELAGGKLVSVLEGGYSLSGLGAASAAHVEALRA